MKKLLALVMIAMLTILTGCYRFDFGLDFKGDGSVDLKTKMVSDPSINGDVLKTVQEMHKNQKVTPVQAGRWNGYEGTTTYKNVIEMAKENKALAGYDIPEQNLKAEGILYRSGILYDYYVLDLVLGREARNADTTHNFDKVDDPGVYFALRVPYGVDSTNADIVSKDKKVLNWDLLRNGKTGAPIISKAAFKIWNKGAVTGIAVLFALALAAGVFFYKKSVSEADESIKKNAKSIAFASLGVGGFVALYVISQLLWAPTLTAKDRITPVYDGKGKVIAQPKDPAVTKDNKQGNADNGKAKEGMQQNAKDKNTSGTNTKSESSNATPAPVAPKANNGQTSRSAAYPAITKGAYVNAYHSSADQEGNYVHSAKLTIDGNTGSCWSEGVKGLGIGENIEIHFNGNYTVNGMNIWIGHQKSQDLFYQNARPTALRVVGSDGSNEIYNLEDKLGPQRVAFKTPIIANKVKLIVERVAPGSKYEDTCISEVEFF